MTCDPTVELAEFPLQLTRAIDRLARTEVLDARALRARLQPREIEQHAGFRPLLVVIPIAAMSSSLVMTPAPVSLLALTIIMNRIVSSFWIRVWSRASGRKNPRAGNIFGASLAKEMMGMLHSRSERDS